jgi:hypothetical protein
MKRREPGWLVLVLAGVCALIGSLLPFYTFADGNLTVWHRGLFPIATLIPLLCVALGAEALVELLVRRELESPFLNFSWQQARFVGAAFAIVLALGYSVQYRAGGGLGSGYLIVTLAALAALAGAVMTERAGLELPKVPETVGLPAEATPPEAAESIVDLAAAESHEEPEQPTNESAEPVLVWALTVASMEPEPAAEEPAIHWRSPFEAPGRVDRN